MEDKLYKKLEDELKEFKAEMKEKGVDYAIDRAYELTTKQEIIDSIQFDHDLSKTQIKALLSRDNVLDELYSDWLSFDGNMREHINYSVDKSLNLITDEYKKDKVKTKNDARQEVHKMSKYVPKELVKKAKEIDLLTYFMNYNPS